MALKSRIPAGQKLTDHPLHLKVSRCWGSLSKLASRVILHRASRLCDRRMYSKLQGIRDQQETCTRTISSRGRVKSRSSFGARKVGLPSIKIGFAKTRPREATLQWNQKTLGPWSFNCLDSGSLQSPAQTAASLKHGRRRKCLLRGSHQG